MPVKVAIVEDIYEARIGLEVMVGSSMGLFCAGAYEDAESFSMDFKQLDVDVVLMDINLPGRSGIQCVQQCKKLRPDVQFLMCTNLEDPDKIYDALCAGATGYLLKNTTVLKLEEAIKDIYAGGSPMTPLVARKMVALFSGRRKDNEVFGILTDREKEVITFLDKGYPYKGIADKLNIKTETVRSYIRSIYVKLQVHSRTDALNKIFPKFVF